MLYFNFTKNLKLGIFRPFFWGVGAVSNTHTHTHTHTSKPATPPKQPGPFVSPLNQRARLPGRTGSKLDPPPVMALSRAISASNSSKDVIGRWEKVSTTTGDHRSLTKNNKVKQESQVGISVFVLGSGQVGMVFIFCWVGGKE